MKEILITSSVLILALLILRLVFGKKVRRTWIYAAWALVALRLLVPVQIGELRFSVLTAAQPIMDAVDERVEDVVLGTTPEAAYRGQVEHYIEKDQTVFVPEVQEQIKQEIAQGNQTPNQIYDKIQQQFPEQEILTEQGQELVSGAAGFAVSDTLHAFEVTMLRIWFAGIAVMAIWFAVVNLRHSRMLRQGRKELHCRSILPVYVSEKVGSPCLVGLFRPAVYLTPESAASEETLRHVLTHELTHYAHKDHIWSLVRCICLCLYWFHPLVWVAAWFSRRDCELACDEGALERLGEEERIAYGKTLLDVVSHAAAHAHLLQTATAMNETKKQLKERVNFIVKKPKWSIIAAVCMVLVCAIITGCVAAGPAASTSPELPELEPDKSPLPSYDTLLQITEGMSLKEVTAIAGAPQRVAKHKIPWSPGASGLARVGWVHVFDSQEGKSVGVAFVLKEGAEDYVAEYVIPDFQDTAEKYTVTVASGEQWLYGPLDEYYIFGETGFLMLRNEPGVEYQVFANGKQLEKVKSSIESPFVSYQFMVGQENVVITVEAQVDQALLEIKQAAVKRFSTSSDTCKPEEVKLTIISQFGDTYALFVDLPFLMYTQALWTDTVNGLKFNYPNGQRMYIYADREFYSFQKAFDEKIITADQLTTIWEDYYEKCPNRKDWFEDPTEPTQPTEPTEPTQPTQPFDPNDMTYTVRVVDEQGNPVQGVTVELFFSITMGRRITDSNGVAKWEHMQWNEDAVAYIVERAGRLEGYIYHGVTFEPDGVFEKTIVAKKQVMRTYRIRFVDEDGVPLENLCVSINYEKAYTDADGYAQWEILEKYGYCVRLEDVPEWYVTKYDIPYDTWELTIVVIKMHDYTVRVVDTQGNPIPNVSCTLVGEREDRLRTDENGCVTWKKFRGNYLLGCSIDVGHDVVGARQYFPEGQTEMTIVLDLTSTVYPMQVVDGDGQPLKGSYIQIKTGNEAIAWDVTDENGMIYWELASAPVYVEYCTEYDLFGGDFMRLEAVRYAWPEGETAMTLVWENKLVTYQIRLVDANGSPVTDVYVRIHPEGGMDSDYRVGTADDHAGMIVFRDLERDYTVRIYYGNEMILYGTFEFAADDTEVTIVVEIPEE